MFKEQYSKWLYISFACIVFFITAVRCWVVPFSHDEAATFFYYIQSGDFLPYIAGVDANNHVLNTFLSWLSFLVFGDSSFSLRLPNLLSLIVLFIACWRLGLYLSSEFSKWLLYSLFLLSVHWLSFFSLCRGYGISMAFLLMALSFLCDIISGKTVFRDLLFFVFCLQLALASNLILIIAAIVLTTYVCLYLFVKKILFNIKTICILLINFFLIYYWINFSFFLQNSNALYYGAGDNYWQVTFVSLINLLIGSKALIIQWSCILFFFSLLLINVYSYIKNTFSLQAIIVQPRTLFLFTFLSLLVAFYLMKILLHVNYPEDRTGLFFYLLFALLTAFTMDILPAFWQKSMSIPVSILVVIHFAININFKKHPLDNFETIPTSFYNKLLDEQTKSPEKISVGGHRMRELCYAFLNYRHQGDLNLMDAPESMHMNSDYSIALAKEEPHYKKFYDELESDETSGYVLLKRKELPRRIPLMELHNFPVMSGDNEYFDFYSVSDTVFNGPNPIMAEFNMDVEEAPVPLLAWIVLDIDSADGQKTCYKDIQLNWLHYDWNNTHQVKCSFISSTLPSKVHSLKCYLWNRKKQQIKFHLNSLTLYRLDADGINYVIPEL